MRANQMRLFEPVIPFLGSAYESPALTFGELGALSVLRIRNEIMHVLNFWILMLTGTGPERHSICFHNDHIPRT